MGIPITVSAFVSDPDGAVRLLASRKSRLGQESARVQRVPTLDGGAVMVHLGTSVADRTWDIEVRNATAAQAATVQHLFSAYTLLRFAQPAGVFSGTIQDHDFQDGTLTCTVLVMEKLSA